MGRRGSGASRRRVRSPIGSGAASSRTFMNQQPWVAFTGTTAAACSTAARRSTRWPSATRGSTIPQTNLITPLHEAMERPTIYVIGENGARATSSVAALG